MADRKDTNNAIGRRELIAGSLLMSATTSALEPTDRLSGARVVVVGAGAFGAWTALHLATAGAEVTVVDPWGPGNARASSGGLTRVIRSVYGGDAIYTSWVGQSMELWQQLQRWANEQIYFERGVLWMFTGSDQYMTGSMDRCRELGFPIDQLDVFEAAEKYRLVSFDGVDSVYFEHRAGYLRAARACGLVLQEAKRRGAKWMIDAAKPPQLTAGSLASIETVGGYQLKADHFVFAAGPWLGELIPEAIGNRVRPTRQEVHYFGPSGELARQFGKLPLWVDFDESIFYGIPEAAGSGFKVADDTRGEMVDPSTLERVPSEASLLRSRQLLQRRFPALARAPLVQSRVCQYENSPDGDLIIDQHPDCSNLWVVGGGSGHGYKLSPAVGQHVAARISGNETPIEMFGLDRFGRNEQPRTQTQFER